MREIAFILLLILCLGFLLWTLFCTIGNGDSDGSDGSGDASGEGFSDHAGGGDGGGASDGD
jgi:hypothetical protein